jgi:molecular chaperone DnaK (HSP70)
MIEIERFTRSLTEREQTILRIGLEASHLEESVAHGDWTRAKAHAEVVAKLFSQTGIR